MDLIPKQFKSQSAQEDSGIKSRGISISGFDPKISVIFSDRRVIWSFVLFMLSLAVWGGLKGYIYYLNSTAQKLEAEITKIENSQDWELAQKFIDADKTIKIYKNLLKNHIYSSQFFDLLEKVTVPQVQWVRLNLSAEDGKAQLDGRAATYTVLSQQLVSFEKSEISGDVSSAKLTKNGVEFTTSISFDKSILLK